MDRAWQQVWLCGKSRKNIWTIGDGEGLVLEEDLWARSSDFQNSTAELFETQMKLLRLMLLKRYTGYGAKNCNFLALQIYQGGNLLAIADCWQEADAT